MNNINYNKEAREWANANADELVSMNRFTGIISFAKFLTEKAKSEEQAPTDSRSNEINKMTSPKCDFVTYTGLICVRYKYHKGDHLTDGTTPEKAPEKCGAPIHIVLNPSLNYDECQSPKPCKDHEPEVCKHERQFPCNHYPKPEVKELGGLWLGDMNGTTDSLARIRDKLNQLIAAHNTLAKKLQ